jgi:DNA-binding NarL/FixJ family response regulator
MVSFLHVADAERRGLPEALDQLLTQRERDVAEFVALGLQDAEIAARLLVSRHTVKEYVKSVYRKLGVHSRVGLTRAVLGLPPYVSPRSGGDDTSPA